MRAFVGQEGLKFPAQSVVAGRYRIEGLLGRGGFGSVYSARHVSTSQLVALKFLALDSEEQGDAAIRRFFQEAKITAQLRHPNTVRLYDFGQAENGALFMAMEMLVGPSLERVLRECTLFGKVLGEQKACEIGISALRSLAEAHASDLVHRDLKPANMVLAEVPGEDRVVKLLDFGIARMRGSSLTGSGTALGTPAYMSPEQCVGQDVDGRSDLYSLAVVLFRCATGQLPFEGSDPLQLMYRHRYERVPDPRQVAPGEVSDSLAEVLLTALAKAPEGRFADARTMRLALEKVAALKHLGTANVIDLGDDAMQGWDSKAGVGDLQPGTPPPLPTAEELAVREATPPSMMRQALRHPDPAVMTPITGKAAADAAPANAAAATVSGTQAYHADVVASPAPAKAMVSTPLPASAAIAGADGANTRKSDAIVLQLPQIRPHVPSDELPEAPPQKPLKIVAISASVVAVLAIGWIVATQFGGEPPALAESVAAPASAPAAHLTSPLVQAEPLPAAPPIAIVPVAAQPAAPTAVVLPAPNTGDSAPAAVPFRADPVGSEPTAIPSSPPPTVAQPLPVKAQLPPIKKEATPIKPEIAPIKTEVPKIKAEVAKPAAPRPPKIKKAKSSVVDD